MLDIRATHYVSPLSEVAFASVPLTVRIANVTDETGLVTGKFRVYNGSTGLLIHSSDIIPLSLAGGATVDASALTNFDPPAPADDTYLVTFDGNASNALVPDGINFALGAFYFDVKPTGMGPAPASHHGTHEDGGSDELDITGLSGLLADNQSALEHGNERHNPDFCPLPDPLDSTHPLRADGLPAWPAGFYKAEDFAHNNNITHLNPWFGTSIASGTTTMIAAGDANHPGVLQLGSAAGGNSGYLFRTSSSAFLIAGSERTDFCMQPVTLAGLVSRRGFLDTFSTADQLDGIYFEIAQVAGVDGTLVGKTANGGTRSTTATSFLLVTNTWYRLRIQVNAAATLVTFSLYSAAGALLWSDTLDTNIPLTAGHETGHGIISFNTIAAANALSNEDLMIIDIARVLTR